MPGLDEAMKIAMNLTVADRATLAGELLRSLPEPPAVDEDDFGRTLIERAEAFDRGNRTASDWR
ncbi:MAG: hypothetical protein M3552_22915, partial [Planctomycetota bacterium]|nr:hypothetical protein [Planctomycetota bacterium]